MSSITRPFVLSLSKGEGRVFQQSAKLIGLLLGLAIFPVTVSSHPLDPALLELVSHDSRVDVLWKASLGRPGSRPLVPILPARCTPVSAPVLRQARGTISQRWTVDCGKRGLLGAPIRIEGLSARGTDALVRIRTQDGHLIQAVLRPDEPFFTVSKGTTRVDVATDYIKLGFEHILTGPDHLLFILGLVLLVQGWRLLLWTITSFTVGHSITLSLAVLGFVNYPPRPVEVLIALSIFVVAVELVRSAEGRVLWIRRFPWALAFVFGLLHGLGFAGALSQVGLPAGEIPLALFSFNIGIEIGQLLFVAIVIAVRAALAWTPVCWPTPTQLIPAYVIGSLSAFWVFERASMIF